jgi:hypothetical protein
MSPPPPPPHPRPNTQRGVPPVCKASCPPWPPRGTAELMSGSIAVHPNSNRIAASAGLDSSGCQRTVGTKWVIQLAAYNRGSLAGLGTDDRAHTGRRPRGGWLSHLPCAALSCAIRSPKPALPVSTVSPSCSDFSARVYLLRRAVAHRKYSFPFPYVQTGRLDIGGLSTGNSSDEEWRVCATVEAADVLQLDTSWQRRGDRRVRRIALHVAALLADLRAARDAPVVVVVGDLHLCTVERGGVGERAPDTHTHTHRARSARTHTPRPCPRPAMEAAHLTRWPPVVPRVAEFASPRP